VDWRPAGGAIGELLQPTSRIVARTVRYGA